MNNPPSTWNAVYSLIGKYHKDTTSKEQEDIVAQLWKARDEYYNELFLLPEIGEYLVGLWRTIPNSTRTAAKLGADYNSSKKGHNAKIHERINSGFAEYLNETDAAKKPNILLNLNLHYRVLLSHDVVDLVRKGHSHKLFNALNRVDELREMLVKSVTKMVSDIASKFAKANIANSVSFTYDDLFQQGMLSVHDATMLYTPDIRRLESNAKWFSFAFS